MKENQYRFEEIEAYLSGTLQEPERAALDQRMAENKDFAKEVQLHRELEHALSDTKALEMAALIQSVVRPESGRSARFLPLFYRLAVAAVFLIGLTVALFLLRPRQTQRLYSEFHQTYPLFLVERSAAPDGQKLLEAAVNAYESGDYKTAIPNFEALSQLEPEHAGYRFYAALCRLENKETNQAIQQFEAFLQLPTNQYTETARWYLALAYLKTKQPEAAKDHLHQIRQGGGDYAGNAADLLEKIN
ncbi:MAG TPA: tetratricopeptide repeat protein [Saprospiraceae bacterium]|nr:tetratricopeptide repeat protein [Saprospiraceae bacterium]HMQ82482.1 tetratricopeptide repeat protein [Saprospiraceae bacterium]